MVSDDVARRWSTAFALQARSDKRAYEGICSLPLPACHRMHQLQMAMEKLCKSHMCASHDFKDGRPDFLHSHKVIAKVLPHLVKEHRLKKHRHHISSQQMDAIRSICREIELLAPAVDDGKRRPDNSEYPWPGLRDGKPNVFAPCQWPFRVDDQLRSPAGTLLLKSAFAMCEE